ncbi:MAG: hypothetical protein AAB490_06515 [Patescibacteria group bacterium]
MHTRSIIGGLIMGLFGGITFGFILWTQAITVTPGTIKSPFFGPQDADISMHLECVSGYYARNGTQFRSQSTYRKTYLFSDVFSSTSYSGGQAQITCNGNNGWTMTDCASYCPGSNDADEEMSGSNSCFGTPGCIASGANDRIYARCCKYTL